jgi:hypothetical protein
MILTCADEGELAEHLTWSSWTATRATATGFVAWRACSADCADSTRWDKAQANVVLSQPVNEDRMLFTKLELHVTGPTPKGFLRDLSFDEAPTAPMSTVPHSPTSGARAPSATASPAAPAASAASSGTLSYANIEGFWIDAGGPTHSSGSFTDAQIAAAITGAESSFLPGNIQQGVDYCGAGADRAGWGLWQITCGNSVPQYGSNFQLLDPWNNAEAAVNKCQADVQAGFNCFAPWSTYTSGAYASYLQSTAPNTQLTDPGEYTQFAATPPGTPSSPAPAPGSTFGPGMPGSSSPPPSASPSPVSVDSAGHTVAFINGSGKLVNDYYISGWQGPGVLPGTPRADSPVVITADGAGVFFIASNGGVVNDYHTSSGWQGPAGTGGSAKAGSGLAVSPDGHHVDFVNTSGVLENDWYSGGWQGPGALPGTPRADSPLAVKSDGTGVFFIASNGAVVNDYFSTANGWQGPGGTGGGAKAGSGLGVSPDGTHIAFVNASGVLVNDWYSGGWQGPGVLPGTPRVRTPVVITADGAGVFFIASNGAVVNDYHTTANGWQGPGGTGGSAKAGSGLAYTPGSATDGTDPTVVFVNTSGVLVNDWQASGWQGPGPLPG